MPQRKDKRQRIRGKALIEKLLNRIEKAELREAGQKPLPVETLPNRAVMRGKGIGVTRHTGQGTARLGTRYKKTPASLYTTIAVVMMRNGKKTKVLVPRDSYVPMGQS
jgi:hypothetical protein